MECSEPKVMGNKAWTHLKLHPIPKDIPKQDKKLLSNYGEFVKGKLSNDKIRFSLEYCAMLV